MATYQSNPRSKSVYERKIIVFNDLKMKAVYRDPKTRAVLNDQGMKVALNVLVQMRGALIDLNRTLTALK